MNQDIFQCNVYIHVTTFYSFIFLYLYIKKEIRESMLLRHKLSLNGKYNDKLETLQKCFSSRIDSSIGMHKKG